MPNLKRIGLANNLFRALEGLEPLAQCPSLEYVDLEDNAVQSVAGYREAASIKIRPTTNEQVITTRVEEIERRLERGMSAARPG